MDFWFSKMNEKKVVSRSIAIALGVISIILLVGLIGEVVNYTTIISNRDSTIQTLSYQITNLQSQIKTWHYNVRHWDSQIPNETMTTEDYSATPIWRIRFEMNGKVIIPEHPDGGFRTAHITVYRWVPLSESIYEEEVVIIIDFTPDFSSVCFDFIGEFHLNIQPYGFIENWTVSIDEYR